MPYLSYLLVAYLLNNASSLPHQFNFSTLPFIPFSLFQFYTPFAIVPNPPLTMSPVPRSLSLLAVLLLVTLSVTSVHSVSPTNQLSPVARQRWRKLCKRPQLVCSFTGTTGNTVSGSAIFKTVRRNGRCVVEVRATVKGLSPGLHGFHIHSFGDVRAADATSAGGHFVSPYTSKGKHGFPQSKQRHWGDLGNIKVGSDGVGKLMKVDSVIRTGRIIGRSMIIHAGPDQGPKSQPSGGAGPRVAKCVIGIINPDYKEEL